MLRNIVLSRCRIACREIFHVNCTHSNGWLRVGTRIFDNAAKSDIGCNMSVPLMEDGHHHRPNFLTDCGKSLSGENGTSSIVPHPGMRWEYFDFGHRFTISAVLVCSVKTTPTTTAILDAATILIQDEVSREQELWRDARRSTDDTQTRHGTRC